MKLLHQALAIAGADAAMLRRFPRLSIAVIGAILAPALYALIYLESVWDPASRTEALPAIIVNLDVGTQAYGRHVDLGSELTRSLQEKRAFGFTATDDEAEARRAVRAGRSLFALIVPRDFSASAMSGDSPGGGTLVLFASEGNNFMGAGFARRFAVELGHQVNETLNEKRWPLVPGATAGSGPVAMRARRWPRSC
jgi:putative membrane protein